MRYFSREYCKNTGLYRLHYRSGSGGCSVGAGSRELKGQYISEELEHMIQERKQRTAKIGEKHYVQAVQGMGEFCLETICPIISGGDVTGAVLLLEKEEKKNPELDEKMAQGAADFLGRQMG